MLPKAGLKATSRMAHFFDRPEARTGLPAVFAAALAAALVTAPANAQQKGPAGAELLKQREQELQAARADQRKAEENEKRLRLEAETLGEDRRKLNDALIVTAARLRDAERRLSAGEARLRPLEAQEQKLRRSLGDRQAVIVEVLAALQRVGRRPLPAVMAHPEDALQSLRTAMMLGAVLPEMRDEAQRLAGDLAELVKLRAEIGEEKSKLTQDMAELTSERQRLTVLIDERQRKQSEAEKAMQAERQNALQLSRQVDNLKDLVTRLEQGLDAATKAARAAAVAAAESKPGQRVELAALQDPGRLAPAISFASARGLLPMPAHGVRIKEFGAPDALGGSEKGISVATRPGAQVTSPCDGWIVYAGPFRSYGQLLIVNAGGGYHILLAGMERISVDLGQFVLTGEPIAVMGGGSQIASTAPVGPRQSVLYIEFRKDGSPVDPGPWWATSENEKVRG
jgi:septal ring factor EnvC (AmiA/AmiB activator)